MAKWNPFTKTSETKTDDGTQTKSEADELLDRFAALIDEKNKPLNEAVSSLKSKWDAIEREAEKSSEPPVKTEELTPEQRDRQEKQALLQLNVQTNARITESDCVAGMSGQWANLIPKVKDIFARTSIQRKAMADYAEYCANVVNMEIGRAARDAGLRSDGNKFFIEDSASKTGGEESPISQFPTWQGDDRTETASETLAKLKIDPKKFAEDLAAGRLN